MDGKLTDEYKKRSRNRILGRDRLQKIWEDMTDITLPSTVTKAPSEVGKSSQPSLGADEWRTFCTINLMISLIALWGNEPKGSRERDILDNFMDLVTAVKIASFRVTSPERRDAYELHMHRYLVGVLKLYPGTTILPNQHKALHVAEQQAKLGPAHVQWCFSFERGNYELQQLNTNNKICVS